MELNADMGEGWYDRPHGDDDALMPYLDACNLACGLHGGDALTMQRAITLALEHDVRIGAHPSFPDRKHFGRRIVELSEERLRALLLYQCGALQAMVGAAGGKLSHVKPHGALYHWADRNEAGARAVVEVARALGIGRVYGPPEGLLAHFCAVAGATFVPEGFVDRTYRADLGLRFRTLPGATLDDPAAAAEQARRLSQGSVRAEDGRLYPIRVQTLCIHGDHVEAVARARAVREVLGDRR